MIDNNYKYCKKCFLISQKAEALPPLGTILGNIGVNTIKFCEEFNNKTINLPNYLTLKVVIYIYENKTFKFIIEKPSISHLMNILKFAKKIKILNKKQLIEQNIYCIYLKDLVQLALFKFPSKNIKLIVPILWGTAKSIGLFIV